MEEPVSIHWRAPKEGWKRALRESEGGTAQLEGAAQRQHGDAVDAGLEHKHKYEHEHDQGHMHTHVQPRATARRKWMPKPPATGGVALGRSDSHPLTLNNHVIRRPVQGGRAPAGVHPAVTGKGGRVVAADTARKPQRRAWGKQALWDDTTNVVDGTMC